MPDAADGRSYALSKDTLWLDTLPSEYLSSTYDLRIYNPSKNQTMNLRRIRLVGGKARGYMLNVDGRSGSEHTNVSIGAWDSVFVFVRAFLPEGTTNDPEPVIDSLEITDEAGQVSYLPIIAVRQNVTHVETLRITSDTQLNDARPLLVRDSIVVEQGARLRLVSPARLWMGAGADIRIYGRLEIEGTAATPVQISAIRRDLLVPRVPYTRVPGQWGGIFFGTEGTASLKHMHLTNGKWGLYFSPNHTATTSPAALIDHCYISNVSGIGLSAGLGQFVIRDSELSNTLSATLHLSGGQYELHRSSIINFYAWPGVRSAAALVYTNRSPVDGSASASSLLTVDHCVLDGAQSVYTYTQSGKARERGGELTLSLLNPSGTVVRVTQSYMRSINYADSLGVQFSAVRPTAADLPAKTYRAVGLDSLARRDYRYDYRPLQSASFVHSGSSGAAHTDLNGHPRNSPMTLGAYEYLP